MNRFFVIDGMRASPACYDEQAPSTVPSRRHHHGHRRAENEEGSISEFDERNARHHRRPASSAACEILVDFHVIDQNSHLANPEAHSPDYHVVLERSTTPPSDFNSTLDHHSGVFWYVPQYSGGQYFSQVSSPEDLNAIFRNSSQFSFYRDFNRDLRHFSPIQETIDHFLTFSRIFEIARQDLGFTPTEQEAAESLVNFSVFGPVDTQNIDSYRSQLYEGMYRQLTSIRPELLVRFKTMIEDELSSIDEVRPCLDLARQYVSGELQMGALVEQTRNSHCSSAIGHGYSAYIHNQHFPGYVIRILSLRDLIDSYLAVTRLPAASTFTPAQNSQIQQCVFHFVRGVYGADVSIEEYLSSLPQSQFDFLSSSEVLNTLLDQLRAKINRMPFLEGAETLAYGYTRETLQPLRDRLNDTISYLERLNQSPEEAFSSSLRETLQGQPFRSRYAQTVSEEEMNAVSVSHFDLLQNSSELQAALSLILPRLQLRRVNTPNEIVLNDDHFIQIKNQMNTWRSSSNELDRKKYLVALAVVRTLFVDREVDGGPRRARVFVANRMQELPFVLDHVNDGNLATLNPPTRPALTAANPVVQRGMPGWAIGLLVAGGIAVAGGITAGVILAVGNSETPQAPMPPPPPVGPCCLPNGQAGGNAQGSPLGGP